MLRLVAARLWAGEERAAEPEAEAVTELRVSECGMLLLAELDEPGAIANAAAAAQPSARTQVMPKLMQ